MSKFKGTPGPWATNFYYGLRVESEKEHGVVNGGWIIAKVEGPDQEANANLIAAAPELLEVLEMCDEAMAYMSEYDIPLTLPDKVKAAIAKAKGGGVVSRERSWKKPTKEKINERVFPVTESGCWIWTGKESSGYGMYNKYLAHRMSYELFIGEIPDGMCVCHKCDIPLCVNPNHLFIGSHKENMKDMEIKGRKWAKPVFRKNDGEPASAKLTKDKVNEIRSLLSLGKTQQEIALIFGVTQGCIGFIKRGKTWAHV